MTDTPTLTTQQANVAYDILTDTAGATEYWRGQFVHTMTQDHLYPVEFRFQGSLGSGGKFRYDTFKGLFYVDCYPENVNDRVREVLDLTNSRLKDWWARVGV